ncbi:DUF6193 family natural product biosynthesis protein [Streptomyces sp. NPDC048637]|uniref:DUF6193 family natural product biosynthesis protein n=1 Tax=Streptomyces sp. NPDC048637 TaxID=3155636 RepID=UPI003415E3BD
MPTSSGCRGRRCTDTSAGSGSCRAGRTSPLTTAPGQTVMVNIDDSPQPGQKFLPPPSDNADLATAHSEGPTEAVEARWQLLVRSWQRQRERHEARTPGKPYPGIVPLLEAARADPCLRQLHPFTSHFTVCLSSCPEYPYVVRAAVTPLHDGRFRVHHPGTSTEPDYADTAEEAVALAAAQLTDGPGPAAAVVRTSLVNPASATPGRLK